jgi:hypothetical protein
MIFIALIGLTLILVRATIFRPLQKLWPAFFECSQCVGTWVGFAAAALGLVSIVALNGLVGRLLDVLLVGFAVSVLSMAVDAVLLKLLGDPHDTMPDPPELVKIETAEEKKS